jgi:hypothetical protein
MTRRLFLSVLSCLPLAWQVKLGPTTRVTEPALSEPAGWCWWHTTFDGQGRLVDFLRVRYNIASRGGLVDHPREIILGELAFNTYAGDTQHMARLLEWTRRPAGAALVPFKSTPVYLLDRSWAPWHVGFLVTPRSAQQLAQAHAEGIPVFWHHSLVGTRHDA